MKYYKVSENLLAKMFLFLSLYHYTCDDHDTSECPYFLYDHEDYENVELTKREYDEFNRIHDKIKNKIDRSKILS